MKTFRLLSLLLALTYAQVSAQKSLKNAPAPDRVLTIEPGIGFHTNMGMDFLITNLVQWNLSRHLSVGAHTSFNINNVAQRDFNFVKTDYNYSLNQKFGVGRTIYSKKSSHSFFVMGGMKYTAYKETLNNPDLDQVSASVSSLSPDYGMMYSVKRSARNVFFTFRMYIPLYPFPTKGADINFVDLNMENIALEAGVGIKVR